MPAAALAQLADSLRAQLRVKGRTTLARSRKQSLLCGRTDSLV